MTHRDRIRMAINHKEPDRVPIDFGGLSSTTVATISYEKLANELGIKGNLPKTYSFNEQTVLPEREIMDRFHTDVMDIAHAFLKSDDDWREFIIPYNRTKCLIPIFLDNWVNIESDKDQNVLLKHKDGTILGEMPNSTYHMAQTYWPYKDLPEIPDAFDDKELNKFMWRIPFPGLHLNVFDNSQCSLLKKGIKQLYETTDYAMLYTVGCNVFDPGYLIRGFDNFLCDIQLDKRGTKRLVSHLLENYMKFIEKVLKTIGEYVEALHFYDDLGYQGGPFMPPEIYRNIFKPAHKKMWDYVHDNSDCKVSLHSCGSIYKLLPDLIDAGLDILNPIQTSAVDMEPERLKKEFGKYITFWGGGCEPDTLAHKTPKEVKEEVKRRIDIFSKNGGYVFSSIHNITAEVKPENIIALYEAAYEYGA